MFKTIRIILISLLLVPGLSQADETNYVWVPTPGGILDVFCQNTFRQYDYYFKTKSIVVSKSGSGGLIAINDMLDNKSPNRLMCTSSAQVITNEFAFKDINFRSGEIDVLLMTTNQSLSWFVPNSNRAGDTLKEQIAYWKSLNRPINVGFNFATAETAAKHLAKKYNLNINFIPHKTSVQMYPSLKDGTLDLVLGAPVNGLDLAETGQFRWIGYSGDFNWSATSAKGRRNFANEDHELRNIIPWLGISTPKNSNPEFKRIIIERIKFIINQPDFRAQYLPTGFNVRLLSGKELDEELTRQHKFTKKLWE